MGLVFKDGIAYQDGSDRSFTGDDVEFITENNLKEVSTYKNGYLEHVRLYDKNDQQFTQIVVNRDDGSQDVYIEGFLQQKLSEEFEYKNLKIQFYNLKNKYSCKVRSSRFLLKEFSGNSEEGIKEMVREFLRNPENITEIISLRHKSFLKKIGYVNYNDKKTFKAKSKRKTHCYNCKEDLDSFMNLSCLDCKWILCICGACGCGFKYEDC
tara:strand:- start:644 stop:1273 length:630 start_codon:yes stop_codon:yes gene_type:complete